MKINLEELRALTDANQEPWTEDSGCPAPKCSEMLHLASPEFERVGVCSRHRDELLESIPELIDLVDIARDAIAYALRRVGTDAEFAYHMLHTETLAQLIRAYALIEGRDQTEVRDEVRKHARALPQSRCATDREFIDGGCQL